MGYYLYILFSASLDRYYIGSAANPNVRLKKHLANHKGFTSRAKDWIICYKEFYDLKSEALERERQLKSWKNRNQIQQLIRKYNE